MVLVQEREAARRHRPQVGTVVPLTPSFPVHPPAPDWETMTVTPSKGPRPPGRVRVITRALAWAARRKCWLPREETMGI